MNESGRRVLILCRQSLSRADSVSIQDQRDTMVPHYAARGWAIAGVMEEENTRAWKPRKVADRADLTEILERARRGEFDTLAVYAIDRLARRVRVVEEIAEELEAVRVGLVSYTEEWASDPFLRQFAAMVAQKYSADLSRKMQSTIAANARRGRHHGAVTIGYVRGDDHMLAPGDPSQVALAQEVYQRALAGEGSTGIATDLRERTGQGWTERRVLAVLRNPAYMGTLRVAGVELPDAHPALIDPTVWHGVQRQLDARRAPKRAKPLTWLAGLVWCGCGQPRYAVHHTSRRGDTCYPYVLLRCRDASAAHGRARCPLPKPGMTAHRIEAAVPALIAADVQRIAGLSAAEAVRRAMADQRRQHPNWEREQIALRRHQVRLSARLERTIELRTDGLISRDAAVKRHRALEAELATVEASLAAGPPALDPATVERLHQHASALAEAIGRMTLVEPSWLRAVLVEFGVRIVVDADGIRLTWPEPMRAVLRDDSDV